MPRRPAISVKAEEDKPAEGEARQKQRRKRCPAKKPRQNQPAGFDLEAELARICGVNLTLLDDVKLMTIQTLG
jgi:hypothetical protein